jgi:ubiquinone/menaquinone biosynthesis C-methylase UbiE
MKKIFCLTFALLFTAAALFAQDNDTEKIQHLKFCGYSYKDTAVLRKHFEAQLNFLQINNGDTIVDIGSSSGAYLGALNVIATFKNVHFILVDIDSNCLNKTKVSNMVTHYQNLRGSVFANTFSLVNNTPDSLQLPANRYKKLFIFNTLHEIDDKLTIAKQMAAVLQSGGELIVAEFMPMGKKTKHQGCKKPLMSEAEIVNLFAGVGFKFTGKENLQSSAKYRDKHPYNFYRLTKL